MNNITKIISAAAAAVLALSMASCGEVENGTQETPAAGSSVSESGSEVQAEQPDKQASSQEEPEPVNNEEPPSSAEEKKPMFMTGEQKSQFKTGAADFSAELFRQCAAGDPSANVLISPESAMFALGMTANGAKDNTLDEMLKVLGSDCDLETLNAGLQNTYLRQSGDSQVLSNANSVWTCEGFPIEEEFLGKCSELFDAEAESLKFDEAARERINGWISDKTRGMIPEALDDIPMNAVMYLINAAAFEDKWAEAYEDYQVKEGMTFTAADGSSQKVTMLSSTEGNYIESEGVQGFVKPYQNGYSFMALLPDEGVGMQDFISGLDGNAFMAFYESRTNMYEVDARIPEFSFDSAYELSDILKAMGMNDAFADTADFSGISKEAATEIDGAFCINRVIHKTHIELDREGTKAAAVTIVEEKCDGEMIAPDETKRVYLDRPFVFAIVDDESGLPVFMGCVNSISEK